MTNCNFAKKRFSSEKIAFLAFLYILYAYIFTHPSKNQNYKSSALSQFTSRTYEGEGIVRVSQQTQQTIDFLLFVYEAQT